MKTKKASPSAAKVKSDTPDASPFVGDVAGDDAPSQNGSERVSFAFYVDRAGRIQTDRLHRKSRETMRQWLQNPELFKALGVSEQAADGKAPEVIPPSICNILYDALGKLESVIAIRVAHVDRAIAEKIFPYTEAEKALLVQPTTAVLNKYVTAWMIRYKEEFALAGLLGMMTLSKIEAAKSLSSKGSPTIVPDPGPATVIDAEEEVETVDTSDPNFHPADLIEQVQ